MATTTLNLIDERAAASRLGVTPAALRKWRRLETGPRYAKLGTAVRYAPADLDAWVAARVVTPKRAA